MNVRPKKHLGQHFLKDTSVVDRMLESIAFDRSEHVLEIGPGMGVLTQGLIKHARKLSLAEIDTESVEYLNEHFSDAGFTIYEEDVLKMDWNKLSPHGLCVVGNFPYNISSQILFKVWDHVHLVDQLVGMFQKEVAQRICAKPKNKSYGILSVLMQYAYETEYLFEVGPENFNPKPKVDSAVIKLTKRKHLDKVDLVFFKQLVKMSFGQRRKKLRNAIKPLITNETRDLDKFLNLRAEALSVSDFVELSHKLNVLRLLGLEHQVQILRWLNNEVSAAVLTELEEDERQKILDRLSPKEIANEVIKEIESDDAADIILEMPVNTRRDVIAEIEKESRKEAEDLVDLLNYSEDTAGSMMGKEFISRYDVFEAPVVDELGRLVGKITVDDVIDFMREEADKDYQLAS
ncbi:unnamed protein product, partial [Cyprideis torosa]